jgi:hypothetical protein
MNLDDDVIDRCLRLRPLHEPHPGGSRSLVRYDDCLHDNFLLDRLSLWWKRHRERGRAGYAPMSAIVELVSAIRAVCIDRSSH